ncbi:glycogen synthase GlgA [Clostridium polynesiense]|uniref:glycogen synthase GlgA n=1 Tax=Clostridium polynesiense TaxID=1325933 RepID=UPI00058BCB53|nr:glycogen synthase GlgA [Clostridium polynesiense]
MKVLFAASEADPFIKTGGLGDVAYALPKYLNELDVDARVVIPKYKTISEEYLKDLEFVKSLNIWVGWRNQYCGIFKCQVGKVTYYLVDNEYYFARDGLYGYYDDGERFAFFDRAVMEMLKEINWKPDVIHCNDWQTGMIPVLHKLQYKSDPFYSDMKSAYSIHNLAFQGIYDSNILGELFGWDEEQFRNGGLEFHGGVSFMKGGINYSDKVVTVSPTYAEEIKTPFYGERMDGLLRSQEHKLMGILNGIDYDAYNPETDKLIFKNYSISSMKDKKINKSRLQKELKLPVKAKVPMLGLVSRLTPQKGIDILISILGRILQEDVQFVVLGTGDQDYEEHFKNLQRKYPDKVSANIKFDNQAAHKIYAASDIFLMPSLFEPCGLGQLIALRYGAVPVVRETGGLKDTIIPYNQYTKEGNGFSFENYSAHELETVINMALNHYKDKKTWEGIMRSAMSSDNSWERSAEIYKKLYKELIQ